MAFRTAVFVFTFLLFACGTATAGMSLIRDQEIEQTLKTYGRPIFEEAGLSPSTVRFILIDNSELNAFVAGGQNIFVNTGLILETKNPEELLGVIAHESGHIAGGHLFRTQEYMDDLTLQAMLSNIIGVAVAAGAKSGEAGMAVGSAGNSLTLRMMLQHSREQESAADQAGVRFLTGAHLPLTGFLSFMEKLASQELLPSSQQSQYVRTHPLTRDRVDFLENTVAQKKDSGQTPAAWTALHSRMKAKLLGFLSPDEALMDKGDSIDSKYGRAIATYRKGKSAEALALLEPLIAAEPKNPYFEELKGQILFESGRIEEATPVYARAVALAPDAGLIRIAYAHALLESKTNTAKNTADAIRQLELALGTEPKSAEAHHMLAVAYGKQGDEGQSRLHMAEEAYMTGKNDFAREAAQLAKQKLKKNSPGWLRADDILDAIKKRPKKKSD